MTKLFSPFSLLMWVGGLVATVIAVVERLVPRLRVIPTVEMRSLLLLAAVLFLGAIATRVVAKPVGS